MGCKWRLPDIAPVVLDCTGPNLYCACAQTAIFDQNYDTAVGFANPDFLYRTDILAIVEDLDLLAFLCSYVPMFIAHAQKLFPGFQSNF